MSITLQRPIERAACPPLENFDRLSRAEFERRYTAMPNVHKAELVEGVVMMPSPVSHEGHAGPHAYIVGWLVTYVATTPGARIGDNGTVRLDSDNEYQPDATLFIDPAAGGQVSFSPEGYLEGAPDLVFEVASTSASYDLHAKKNAYRRNGVREYVVWRVKDAEFDWFVLRDGEFMPLLADGEGRFHSETFPGLALDAPAMLAGDLVRVSETLRLALQSDAHAQFVSLLAAKRRSNRAPVE